MTAALTKGRQQLHYRHRGPGAELRDRHPRELADRPQANEWVWMLAATDPSTFRPIVQPNQGAYNPAGLQDGQPTYEGVAGYLFNLPVILDSNMPTNLGAGTNETRVVIADFEDLILFEDANGAPSQLRFE